MQTQQVGNTSLARFALACGALGVLTALWIYWLVLPGLLLGLAAVVLALRARRHGRSELRGAALTLGIVAVLLVPSVILIADSAEDWGRDCALHPANSDC